MITDSYATTIANAAVTPSCRLGLHRIAFYQGDGDSLALTILGKRLAWNG